MIVWNKNVLFVMYNSPIQWQICIYTSETRILEIYPSGIFREILSNYIYESKIGFFVFF